MFRQDIPVLRNVATNLRVGRPIHPSVEGDSGFEISQTWNPIRAPAVSFRLGH